MAFVVAACALFGCTDAGAIGQLRPRAAQAPVAGSNADNAQCALGSCEVSQLCGPAELWCPFCESDADCSDDPSEPLCSDLTATCVQCRGDGDCPANAPFCDGGECGQCADDDDCGDDRECNDGRCEQ
jgi:hypothetical protein